MEGIEAQGSPFRYTSPYLQGEAEILYTCPVGLILKEYDWVYSVIDAAGFSESTSITEYRKLSRFMQQAIRLVNSERMRLRDIKNNQQKLLAQSKQGMRIRNG